MKRLRILQIFSRYREYGGEEGSVYRIGDAIQELHDVEYFLTSSHDVFSGHGWKKWLKPLYAYHNPDILRRLSRYQTAGRFNLWQIHNVFPAMSPSVYVEAFRRGVPIIHYLHNYRLSCVNGFFLNHGAPCQRCMSGNFWPAFETACWHGSRAQSGFMGLVINRARRMDIFKKINRWVAISEAQKREHVAMGIPAENISVVPHFLDAIPVNVPASGGECALFVGRLSPEKGVDHLLRAWALVQGPGRSLIIMGDGPERSKLEALASELGLKDVVFTGFLRPDRQQEIWKKAAFTIVPSVWKEPFGMVVLESWSRAKPVIVHDIGALPELVRDGVNGLVVPEGRTGHLAGAMDRLFETPRETASMGMNGLETLLRRFSKARWLQDMSRVYNEVGLT